MPGKPLITEASVLDALRAGRDVLAVPPGALITPLARDVARARGLRIEVRAPEAAAAASETSLPAAPPRVVALGSDHGGFDYKQLLAAHLGTLDWKVIDVGTHSDASVDYPDFAYAVAHAVRAGKAALGIMLDGAGLGSAMVCNKVPGIRAACAYNEFTAWNGRAHNDANVLTLGSRTLGIEVCKRIVEVFLATDFEGGRHQGRVDKITDVERRFFT